MSPVPEPRIGDAEREAASSALGDHFVAGRLTREEYDERSDRVWAARTASDLAPLFTDLPSLHPTRRPPPAPAWDAPGAPDARRSSAFRSRGVPFLPVLLIALVVLVALPGPPWLLLLFGALWWGCLRSARHGRGWVAHRTDRPGQRRTA